MELLKLLSTSEIVAQIISFLILFLFLKAFAWKRILDVLDQRRKTISDEFAKIESVKNEAEALKKDFEAKIKVSDEIGRKRIQEAIVEAQKIASEIKINANQEAEKVIEAAKITTRHEIDKAKEQLKEEIIDLTMKATEQVLQNSLTESQDRKVVADFLKEIDNAK